VLGLIRKTMARLKKRGEARRGGQPAAA